jgi:hypothetical protein
VVGRSPGNEKREAPRKKSGGVPGRGLSPERRLRKRKGGRGGLLETRSGFGIWNLGALFFNVAAC